MRMSCFVVQAACFTQIWRFWIRVPEWKRSKSPVSCSRASCSERRRGTIRCRSVAVFMQTCLLQRFLWTHISSQSFTKMYRVCLHVVESLKQPPGKTEPCFRPTSASFWQGQTQHGLDVFSTDQHWLGNTFISLCLPLHCFIFLKSIDLFRHSLVKYKNSHLLRDFCTC